jgi:hypothetical protein
MNAPGLWLVAVNAFAAVLVLLGALAGTLRLLTALFPPSRDAAIAAPLQPPAPAPDAAIDAATLAAVQAAVARTYPGGRVTHVAPADEV